MSKHQQFWNKEYKTSKYLMLSDEPAEDLEKFCRFLERHYGRKYLNDCLVSVYSVDYPKDKIEVIWQITHLLTEV